MENLNKAENMYQYCIEHHYGQGITKEWGIKHFEVIEQNLLPDEIVYMTFIGLHNFVSVYENDSNYAYAITNKRIIMAQKRVAGEELQTVSLNNVNDITLHIRVIVGVITIDTMKEKFNVAVWKSDAIKINSEIHRVLDEIKGLSETKQSPVKEENVNQLKELKELKDLLDSGAINKEEFEKIKKNIIK